MGLPEHVATLSPELWEVAWKDLVEIVEWGIVSCCISPVPSVRRGVEQQPWSQVSLLWLSPRPSACPDASWGGVGPWEEPQPGLGPGMLQVGQLGQKLPRFPIVPWLMTPPCFTVPPDRSVGQGAAVLLLNPQCQERQGAASPESGGSPVGQSQSPCLP